MPGCTVIILTIPIIQKRVLTLNARSRLKERVKMSKRNGRQEKLHPPCRDDPCEFYQFWSRVDLKKEYRVLCAHPDHPDSLGASPDEKCPKLIDPIASALHRQ